MQFSEFGKLVVLVAIVVLAQSSEAKEVKPKKTGDQPTTTTIAPTIKLLCGKTEMPLTTKATCDRGQPTCSSKFPTPGNLGCTESGKVTPPKCDTQVTCIPPVEFIVACDAAQPALEVQPLFTCKKGTVQSLPTCENKSTTPTEFTGTVTCVKGSKLTTTFPDKKSPCKKNPDKLPCMKVSSTTGTTTPKP